jgi:hypothetical protein
MPESQTGTDHGVSLTTLYNLLSPFPFVNSMEAILAGGSARS